MGAVNMAVSRLRFDNALVGSEWATAVLLCTNRLRKQSSCPARIPFLGERLPAECRDYCQLVNGGCGLSHERVEDGCKSTCVELGG